MKPDRGTVRANIAANFAGKGWSTALSLLFIPLYLHYLGVEAYGLVGVFGALSAITGVMDLGLKTTVNREMARISAEGRGGLAEGKVLVRTMETVYWGMAVLIGCAVVFMAPLIVGRWVRLDRLPPADALRSIQLMGVAIAVSWPNGCYLAALQGLQKHVSLNVLSASMDTIKGVGAILVLHFVSPTIRAFFLWQVIVTASTTLLGALYLRKVLSAAKGPARIDWATFRRCRKFAVGMSALSLLAVLVSQVDKVVLSRLLRFDQFGYYVLAASVARPSTFLVNGVYAAVFPRMSQLFYAGDGAGLKALYHKGAQLVSVTLLPVVAVLSLCSSEVLYGWTGKADVVANCHVVVMLLLSAYGLDALLVVPQALQLAHGATRLLVLQLLTGLCVVVPLILFLARRYGAAGGALSWVVASAATVAVFIPVIHRLYLRGELARWLVRDLAFPLAGALAVAVPGKLLMPAGLGRVASLAWVSVLLLLSFLGSLSCVPGLRREALSHVSAWRSSFSGRYAP